MDIDKYLAGKASGVSKIALQGKGTLLITWPDGYDPDTGAALPPKEQGFQRDDLVAMHKSAVQAVTDAESALAKARARRDGLTALLLEAKAALEAKA